MWINYYFKGDGDNYVELILFSVDCGAVLVRIDCIFSLNQGLCLSISFLLECDVVCWFVLLIFHAWLCKLDLLAISNNYLFQVSGKIVFGSTVNPLSTLPRANKVDPLVSIITCSML